MKNYDIVNDSESLEKAIARAKKAQKEFAKYSQEEVDKIFFKAALAANQARIPLAKLAVEETGMGVVEDKVIKNHFASEYIYNKYKNTKTCGVLEEDKAFGIKKIAEPIGIIAAVIPTTNPTSTAIFKTLIALKTRNAIIISPHPRAKKCTIEAAKIVLEAAVEAGAPEGIISWIDVPSLELTNMLMSKSDTILATGGPGMVKAAYSSGKPALGVGAGNTPAIIDESANIVLAVISIILSKTFDNGMICASEQSVIVMDSIYDKVKEEFKERGCYFLNDEEIEKVRKTIIIDGSLNAKIVGQTAYTIAKLADVEVPESTKILIGEVENVDSSEEFAHEKLSPVLAMYKAKTFEEAIEITKIYSIAGNMPQGEPIINNRQYRAPHYSITPAALIGGGIIAKPGEISLAHNGVLLLDELPQINKNTLELLRSPMEEGQVNINRLSGNIVYPCRFMLVASMNPCPCGYYGSKEKECTCSETAINKYMNRLSGPLLDRIDIQVEVNPVKYTDLKENEIEETSTEIRKRVNKARKKQRERYKEYKIFSNSELNSNLINKFCILDEESEKLLHSAFERLKMSARAYTRILKVARTIADLDNSEEIKKKHIAEAIQYRSLDRKYWTR